MSARTPAWAGVALVLAAASLRLPIASVAPVLDDVRETLGLSSTAAGVLTMLPVLCFGLAGPIAAPLARRWGDEAIVLGCLLAVPAGVLVRVRPDLVALFVGTLVLSIGIALANVLMPGVIKRGYALPGTMMGLYTMALTGSAAVGAGLTVPLMGALGSWEWALGVWAIPAAIATFLWVPVLRRRRGVRAAEPTGAAICLWRDRTAWLLTGLMGCQSLLFYVLISWIPDVLRDSGSSPADAGYLLSIAMLCGLPGSLWAPIVAARMRDQRILVILAAVPWWLGLAGLLIAPGTATLVWMVLLGMGQGIGFGLCLTLIVLRAPDGAHTAALSGMVQGVAYLVAATGPLAVGLLHDLTGEWSSSLSLLCVVVAGLLLCGLGSARPGFVGTGPSRPRC